MNTAIDRVNALGTQPKGLQDFVTEADKQTEQTIQEASAWVVCLPMDSFIANGGEVFFSTPALSDQIKDLLLTGESTTSGDKS